MVKIKFKNLNNKSIALLSVLFLFNLLSAQHTRYDKYYLNILKIETDEILPGKSEDTLEKKVLIINPFVEYRYYGKNRIPLCLLDSSFACERAKIDSNYILFPNKAKFVQSIFALQINNALLEYRDTLTISLPKDAINILKKILDSIVNKANNFSIKEYRLNESLLSYFKLYHGDHLVITDVLVYQSTHTPPNLFIKYTFFVLDLKAKKMFYYKNGYHAHELFGKYMNLDLIQDDDLRKSLKTLVFPKKIPKTYAKYLKMTKKNK